MLKRRGSWLVAGLVMIAVIVATILSVVVARKKSTEALPSLAQGQPVASAPQTLEFLPEDVLTVSVGEVQKKLSLSGALRAVNQAAVKAKLAGDVREVLVREGETVQSGQVLVKMDTADYAARLAQARGSLAAAQGQLEIARQARDNNKSLLDKNFISRNAYDNSSNQYVIATANVDSAKGALEVAQKALADTVIRAPIAGTISSRSVQPGEKISPDNRLFDMLDLRWLEMEAPVPTQDIASIRIGQRVQIKIEGLAQAVNGKVSRINPATTAGSRSVMTYIQIANPDLLLRAGMFGEAQLVIEQKSDVSYIPLTAVRYDGARAYVYTIEQAQLQKAAVTLGLQGDNSGLAVVEIVSGLARDSRVVKRNLGDLRVGLPVKLLQPAGKV